MTENQEYLLWFFLVKFNTEKIAKKSWNEKIKNVHNIQKKALIFEKTAKEHCFQCFPAIIVMVQLKILPQKNKRENNSNVFVWLGFWKDFYI